MNVGVIGAHGKMGLAICDALAASSFTLGAQVGRNDDLSVLAKSQHDVVVDVSNAEAARHNLPWVALHGMYAVVGTTGFTDDDIASFDAAFKQAGKACFVVPNFSIGAVLMMQFAAQAAPYFDGVEIIELHHEKKKDAPSGTAALTARKIAAARETPFVKPVDEQPRGISMDGIPVHSVRLPGLLAHQEVLFGGTGQSLTIRHDSYDRSSFMPGVLKAVAGVVGLPAGVTFGLEAVLPSK